MLHIQKLKAECPNCYDHRIIAMVYDDRIILNCENAACNYQEVIWREF